MIEIENVLIAEKPIDAVWLFISEIRSITACVPTVVKYEVEDADTVNCDLRIKLGLIPLDSKARVSITKREQNRFIEIQGRTDAGESLKKYGKLSGETFTHIRIAIKLDAMEPCKTRIHFNIKVQAAGQVKRVYDAIINGQRLKLEKQFVERLSKGLGSSVSIETPGMD